MIRICFAIFACSLVGSAHAQGCINWSLKPNSDIGRRYGHRMAFHERSQKTVLFGGEQIGTGLVNETWTWEGSHWNLEPSLGPSRREYHAMAYDPVRGNIVLFGGNGDNTIYGDTWLWDGDSWDQVSVAGPAARFGHAMTFDSARGVVVLFGGMVSFFDLAQDTWEWDGTAWQQVASEGPSARYLASMAYDEHSGRSVLFGGIAETSEGFSDGSNDTWEWDGWSWNLREQAGPTPRWNSAMWYDRGLQRVCYFGGARYGEYFGDTRSWSGTTWELMTDIGPSPRQGHEIAFDTVRNVAVLYGDVNSGTDVWEWRSTLTGDLNSDGVVGLPDLATLLAHFGDSQAAQFEGDLNGDQIVGLPDLALLLASFGAACD